MHVGFGGSLCEGSVRDVRLNGDNTLDSVQPGDVDYYLLRPTPANFRFAVSGFSAMTFQL